MNESNIVEASAVEVVPDAPTPTMAITPLTLFGSDDPDIVVAKASKTASALVNIIEKRQLYSNIKGKKHPRVEAWTLLGSMLGVFPVTQWTKPLRDGDSVIGWEARVEARTLGGSLVGGAEAMCSRFESRWREADDYAIRSMAQTRATSKALGMPLRFIMQLAGFEGTAAEEMPAGQQSNIPPARSRANAEPKAEMVGRCTTCDVDGLKAKAGKTAGLFRNPQTGEIRCNGLLADGTEAKHGPVEEPAP